MNTRPNDGADACLADRLRLLFGMPVACSVASPEMYDEPLLDGEELAVSHAVPKRRREYAAGRAAARRALRDIGIPPVPIRPGPDRAPQWPPTVVGSISHCEGCCVAVVANRGAILGLGIDVETTTALPSELLSTICNSRELENLAPLRATDCDVGKLLFCAKEAFYKCYYPLTKTFLEFSDVFVSIERPGGAEIGTFTATLVNPLKAPLPERSRAIGRWLVANGHVFAGVTCTASSIVR